MSICNINRENLDDIISGSVGLGTAAAVGALA